MYDHWEQKFCLFCLVQLEFSYIAGGNANDAAIWGNYLAVSYKVKPHSPYNPAISFPNIYSREIEIYVYLKTCMQMSSSFIHNLQNLKEI